MRLHCASGPASILPLLLVSIFANAAESTEVAQEPTGAWRIENASLRATLDPQSASITVQDKRISHTWSPSSGGIFGEDGFQGTAAVHAPAPGVAFNCVVEGHEFSVTVTMPADAADLIVETDGQERDVPCKTFPSMPPLLGDVPRAGIVLADYSNGHLYTSDGPPPPRRGFSAGRLDMPWIGVFDMARGFGYALIIDTADDGHVELQESAAGDGKAYIPQVFWQPSKGSLRYRRRLIYRFVPSGGYVALAKAYREHARQQGLLVTLGEKAKKNANVRRLFGAPDVWGRASLAFAREAKAAGVDKMLIHGRSTPEEMAAINALGFLTSEYDNYTDILPVEEGHEADHNHDHLPGAAVLKADGTRMTAWITWDKKTRYMKRSPALWTATARRDVPKVLAEFPFLGRFVDVTTAEGLYEDYDPNHPLTRSDKRRCGEELLACVRLHGLVTGGEHGIWWAVPHLDYIEGMMSGGHCSWPAGHLLRPKSKDQEFTGPWGKTAPWESYARWGIGHEHRVPLWELVFHDCIVSTWYWGDSSDFLLEAAPEVTAKKDAFNILYGTMPMMWANAQGSWTQDRAMFLRTYRNVCKLHEVIAGTEMLTHEFVTPDRHVQRTTFSDGTEVCVNFGEKPYEWKEYVLPQNGFAVIGPGINQRFTQKAGEAPCAEVVTGAYRFASGEPAETMRRIDQETLQIVPASSLMGTERRLDVDLSRLAPEWQREKTRAFGLDAKGERIANLSCEVLADGAVRIQNHTEAKAIELVRGSKAEHPDLMLTSVAAGAGDGTAKQGEKAEVASGRGESGQRGGGRGGSGALRGFCESGAASGFAHIGPYAGPERAAGVLRRYRVH